MYRDLKPDLLVLTQFGREIPTGTSIILQASCLCPREARNRGAGANGGHKPQADYSLRRGRPVSSVEAADQPPEMGQLHNIQRRASSTLTRSWDNQSERRFGNPHRPGRKTLVAYPSGFGAQRGMQGGSNFRPGQDLWRGPYRGLAPVPPWRN